MGFPWYLPYNKEDQGITPWCTERRRGGIHTPTHDAFLGKLRHRRTWLYWNSAAQLLAECKPAECPFPTCFHPNRQEKNRLQHGHFSGLGCSQSIELVGWYVAWGCVSRPSFTLLLFFSKSWDFFSSSCITWAGKWK